MIDARTAAFVCGFRLLPCDRFRFIGGLDELTTLHHGGDLCADVIYL